MASSRENVLSKPDPSRLHGCCAFFYLHTGQGKKPDREEAPEYYNDSMLPGVPLREKS